ncbi:hypothetical protein [Domibacillus iocasae]|uniref:hypothetical protein n=1 Tax=Domibacillus iocasae TaxID=1714016 RepID=UPI003CCBB9DE
MKFIQGYKNSRFNPKAAVQRAQAAKTIYKMLEKSISNCIKILLKIKIRKEVYLSGFLFAIFPEDAFKNLISP